MPAEIPSITESGHAGAPIASETALLSLIAQLVRETRSAPDAPLPALDSRLDRDLGIDSLALVELLMRIESAFGVRLPAHLVASVQTPRDLLRAILAGTPRAAELLRVTPIAQPAAAIAPHAAATLIEALDWHVAREPDRVHVMLLDETDEGEPMTYGELRAEAQRVASGLARRGVGAGQAVAIMLPTSRDFFRAFVGILLAGAVPVPIYPPLRWSELAEHLRRQSRILENCRATLLVTVDGGTRVARMLRTLVPSLVDAVTVDALAQGEAAQALPVPRAGDLALLQYTSGSTGDPKGVMLTHANLLANIRAMGSAVRAGPDDVFVSWLPLYHDMGLIGAWMGALYFGFVLVVMPPTAFLERPARWLRAVHRYRGTLSSAPNFAYEMCATRLHPDEIEGLDLASWRLAFNGAEPVSADTLERFAHRYAVHGLRAEALAPVYGLAECAVGLAFPPLGRRARIDRVQRAALGARGEALPAPEHDPAALRFASCGVPLPGHEIRVVDAEGAELPERHEGRIQFRGPSATSGYFREAAKTHELFDGMWLDSGDLGYIAEGELYVTSRAKDVIIRGGQHVHPYELEESIGRLPGVRKGCVAVFGVADPFSGTEKVVVLAESRLAAGPARDALRESIGHVAVSLLGSPADDIVIAPPHTVLKTSSGKIRRAASRDAYVDGIVHGGTPSPWRGAARFIGSLCVARLARAGRSASRAAYAALVAAVGAGAATAAFFAALLPQRWHWPVMRGLAQAVVHAARLPLAVRGLANIPASGPLVLVANHASYIDGLLLYALLPRRVRFVAKRELARQPLLRFVLRAAGVVFVERFDVERSTQDARQLAALVREGHALLFFPEGTFTRAPGLLPFHMGAFVASTECDAPIVPVALRGTRSVLRDGQWMPRRAPVRVWVGEARRPIGNDWRAAVRLRESIRTAVLGACGEPDLAQAVTAVRPDQAARNPLEV